MRRVLLAHLPPVEIETLLPRIVFKRFTERAVVSPEKLRQILRLVRRNGFSIIDQELAATSFSVFSKTLILVPILEENSVRIFSRRISSVYRAATAEVVWPICRGSRQSLYQRVLIGGCSHDERHAIPPSLVPELSGPAVDLDSERWFHGDYRDKFPRCRRPR
jgi:acetolactate synthase regulatory subunit